MQKVQTIKNIMTKLILNSVSKSDIPIRGIIFDMDGTLCKPQVCVDIQPSEYV